MRQVLMGAALVIGLAACGAETPGEGRARALDDSPALASAVLSNTTIKFYNRYDGTQYHYLGADGLALLVEPGKDRPSKGRWFIKSFGDLGNGICMRHQDATANVIVSGSPRNWNCGIISSTLRDADEIYDGDVLGLRTMATLPRQLPRRTDVPINTALAAIGRPPVTAPNKAVAFD